jgi:hypothetical protein
LLKTWMVGSTQRAGPVLRVLPILRVHVGQPDAPHAFANSICVELDLDREDGMSWAEQVQVR